MQKKDKINLFSKQNIEKIALLLSVIAIIISIKSCQLSQEATDLNRSEFTQTRLITLTATIDNKEEELKVKSTENDKILLAAFIMFPDDLIKNSIQIKSPNFKFSLLNLKYEISKRINEGIKRTKDQTIIIDSAIPVIIESQYTAKRITYIDKSIYRAEFTAVISDKTYEPPTIKFTGLLFLQHLSLSENAKEVLSKLWNHTNKNNTMKLNHLTNQST